MTAWVPITIATASVTSRARRVRNESERRSFATLGRTCAAAATVEAVVEFIEVVAGTRLGSLYRACAAVAPGLCSHRMPIGRAANGWFFRSTPPDCEVDGRVSQEHRDLPHLDPRRGLGRAGSAPRRAAPAYRRRRDAGRVRRRRHDRAVRADRTAPRAADQGRAA